MKAILKLMIAAMSLTTVMAAAAPAGIKIAGPEADSEIGRACYNAYGQIVPCKRWVPKY